MTYLTAKPQLSTRWDDICYPVSPVWLADILPDYEIIASDRQQLIVGEPARGRKMVFGIQSADYSIIPNVLIREVVDKLFQNYSLQIKYTVTGEFNITVIFPQKLSVGDEYLQQSLILTNSYNGKTPFTIQGHTLAAVTDDHTMPSGSVYRPICKNGLMGWADGFEELDHYRQWLKGNAEGKTARGGKAMKKSAKSAAAPQIRKIHHSKLTPELFQEQLHEILSTYSKQQPALTTTVYQHFQSQSLSRSDEKILRTLPIPVQLAKQAHERLRLEEQMLNTPSSYWLVYNAVNHALFNARSSLTLNDRYKLDERVFHQLAARSFA